VASQAVSAASQRFPMLQAIGLTGPMVEPNARLQVEACLDFALGGDLN
jgi:hypothetical protein